MKVSLTNDERLLLTNALSLLILSAPSEQANDLLEKMQQVRPNRTIPGAWRIVETDNFGGDYPDESFIDIIVYSKDKAEAIAKAINAAFPENHRRYWKVVEDGYELVPGFEP